MKRFSLLFICVGIFCLIAGNIYAAPQQISLRFMWWGGESRHKATVAAIELYMKKNPTIKISGEYTGFNGYQQKLLTQLAGGTAADIIQIDQPWLAELVNQGNVFVNLKKVKGLNTKVFEKKFLDAQCSVNQKLFGLPTGVNGETYYINKGFFAQHKISVNTDWNWDSLVKIGERVHKENSRHYLMTMSTNQTNGILKHFIKQRTGKQFINDDYTPGFDKQVLTDAFGYYKKLLDSGTLQPIAEAILFEGKTETNPKWGSGEVGMTMNWASAITPFYQNNQDIGVTRPSIMKGAKDSGIIVRPAQLLVVNSESSHQKEVAAFLNWFFTDPEAILSLGTERGVPATAIGRKILMENKLLDPNMSLALGLATKNASFPENAISTNTEIKNIFEEYIQKVGFNKLTPEQAATEMLNQFEKKLAELKATSK